MLVLVLVGAGTGNADGCAVPDTLVPFAEGALVPAGVLVAMPIVVGPRVAPPMPAPVPALEVVAVALAADAIAGAGSAVLLPSLFSLSPRRRYSCRPFRCRRRCAPPGDEPPRTREAETATTKRTTETEDCAYAGRS